MLHPPDVSESAASTCHMHIGTAAHIAICFIGSRKCLLNAEVVACSKQEAKGYLASQDRMEKELQASIQVNDAEKCSPACNNLCSEFPASCSMP